MTQSRRSVGPRIHPETDLAIKKAFSQVQRGEHERALETLRQYYAKPVEKVPPEGLSYYGLCLAVVEKRYREAVRVCRAAIDQNEFHGESYANLARVYVIAGSRRKAVESIDYGLARVPDHPGLLRLREEIGYRRTPVIPFLSRDNFLNVFLGRARHRKLQERRGRR